MICNLKEYRGCDYIKAEIKKGFKNIQSQSYHEDSMGINSEITKIIALLNLLVESADKSNNDFVKRQLKDHPEFQRYFPNNNEEAKP